MIRLSVEHHTGVVAKTYRFYPEIHVYEVVEEVGEIRDVQSVELEAVPEYIKKAISILMEGDLI